MSIMDKYGNSNLPLKAHLTESSRQTQINSIADLLILSDHEVLEQR